MRPELTPEQFLEVVDRTPLVSIDFIVRDRQRRLLLGLRVNDPARGFWFVPGGRIRKGESLDEAFARILGNELGVELPRTRARLLGLFTHLYDTNFADAPQIDTHYVVLAYEVNVELELISLPRKQHSEYQWWALSDAEKSKAVHPHNLPYFKSEDGLPFKSDVWIAQ